MPFGKKKARISPQEALAARPVRLVKGDMQPTEAGAKLKVPLRSGRFGWLFKLPEGATKTFELDAIGLFVWEQIDGKTSVQQIIRKLSRKFGLSEREAAVSTNLFLQTLGRKNLIGWKRKEEN